MHKGCNLKSNKGAIIKKTEFFFLAWYYLLMFVRQQGLLNAENGQKPGSKHSWQCLWALYNMHQWESGYIL